MSISVTLELGYEFEVNASFKKVFDVLSDVPTSAGFYPQVEELVDMGDNTYRWEMEKVGTDQVNLQVVYASQYVINRKKGSIAWTAVEGVGNSLIAGSWQLTNHKKTTHIVLTVEGEITLPFPALMRRVVQPVVKAEFERLTEEYIAKLCEHFGGEVED
ncbi:MAG: SRPBCC family protein [Candidatus Saccharibacteria bacterium]|nr:SRPBCC family protein [Rhodoferax sp.]